MNTLIKLGPIPKLTYRRGRPGTAEYDLVAAGVTRNGGAPDPALASLGPLRESGDFRGDPFETALLYSDREGDGPGRLLAAGLGDGDRVDPDLLRRWSARVAREARRVRVIRFAVLVPEGTGTGADRIRACAVGAVLGSRFPWKEEDAPPVEEIVLFGDAPESEGARAAETGAALAAAVLFARRLAMEPANRLGPSELAAEAERLALEGGASVTIWDEKKIEGEGLHSLLAVGRGSDRPPRFIRIEYDGTGGKGPVVALVGKGIVFDSGGLSLKAPDRMMQMKYDMSGAAAVLAATRAALALRLPIRLVTVVPTAENLPGPRSYRPGDVIDTYKGLTVEVDNTDAEGRLILADGLAWTEKNIKPEAMIDVATLTGACKIALGRHGAGLFSNDDGLAGALADAGDASGQRVWRMPLWPAYDKELKSDLADMRNIARSSAVGGGAVVAAKFLERFVDRTKWAHIDIAGVAWSPSDHDLGPGGPTGFGAAILLAYLIDRAGS
ncbi:MAG: M17 family peptidase N-terminal domain-containing protein [Candidatus Eisenbacteria bacterium]